MARKKLTMKSVAKVKPSASPAHNVGGGPGHGFPQQPIPGPTNPGQPVAMKKALSKKARGGPTGYGGNLG